MLSHTHWELFINKQAASEHVCAPRRGLRVTSVSCFTEGLLYAAWPLNGSRNETQAKYFGRGNVMKSDVSFTAPSLLSSQLSKLLDSLERKAVRVFAEFRLTY